MEPRSTEIEGMANRLSELADIIGRLRRQLDPEPSSIIEWRLNLASAHIETLLSFLEPTAADLTAWTFPGDDEAAIAACDYVDERTRRLRVRLGMRACQ